MSAYDDELAARAARARDVALFRYSVIRAAADPGLSPRQRGLLVRELAAGLHKDPAGQLVSIGRSTLDRLSSAMSMGPPAEGCCHGDGTTWVAS